MVDTEQIQEAILHFLNENGAIENSLFLAVHGKLVEDQQMVLGALKRLAMHEMVSYETLEAEKWELTEEGQDIAVSGSHEARVFNAIPAEGIEIQSVESVVGPSGKIGQNQAFKNKWIRKDGSKLLRAIDSIVDETKNHLNMIKETGSLHDEELLKELKKRKLVEKNKTISYSVKKGIHFRLEFEKLATDLTQEMLKSGSWKSTPFKKYNFDSAGLLPNIGHLHPLLKVREEFRKIFLEMGFQEMPTNRYVESSFWNFDTLFQPQQHPARDAHDTFFLKNPATSSKFPAEYLDKTREIHSNGGYGSLGYRYDWKIEEAQKNVLRTHTTSVSSRMLYQLAQQPVFKPVKYFSIDKVFRNETVDATHLAEFNQIEGLIADYDLTLGDLIGVLNEFFKKLGMSRLRFKPAYNPYTEPSMEIFAYHEGLKKWIEVGNSGVFRPEMLRPMGFDERVSVIAWGLSLERPTMIKYKVSNIRDLVGHKVDLSMIHSNPICRLDK